MLGQRLKELRKNRSLTQRELAKELGISASALGMYEQDRREPDYETLMNICNYFQVSSDFLLDGKPHSTSCLLYTSKSFELRSVFHAPPHHGTEGG